MAEEEGIAETNLPGAIVLGERVLVEVREGGGESLLDLPGERHATVCPVDREELGELVGSLDDAHEGLGNKRAVRAVASHLADQQEGHVTQLHGGARLDGQRGDDSCLDLRDELANAGGDGGAALVELVLPEHAAENAAAQGLLRGERDCRRTLMSAETSEMAEFEDV